MYNWATPDLQMMMISPVHTAAPALDAGMQQSLEGGRADLPWCSAASWTMTPIPVLPQPVRTHSAERQTPQPGQVHPAVLHVPVNTQWKPSYICINRMSPGRQQLMTKEAKHLSPGKDAESKVAQEETFVFHQTSQRARFFKSIWSCGRVVSSTMLKYCEWDWANAVRWSHHHGTSELKNSGIFFCDLRDHTVQ